MHLEANTPPFEVIKFSVFDCPGKNAIKRRFYGQLLQGLVNINCGSDALDLQEQIRRGHVGLEDEQAHDLGTLLNDLNKAKTDVEAKVEAAKLNMNTTPEQQAKLEKDLARIIAAIVRSPSRLPLRRPAA